jgi:ribosomal protein S18 acetylase RimI-like enzyme
MTSANLPSAADVRMRQANLQDANDQRAIVRLLSEYASLLLGREEALPPEVRRNLIPALQRQPGCVIFLALVDEQAIGVATCFFGFSTFEAKPLLNLHDLAVSPDFQQRGIGGQLIDFICDYARQCGCCAMTLEVQANNPARRLYASKGFQHLALPIHGETMLFAKLTLK